MKILHIETSSKNCSVAISDGEELLCLCEEVSENYKQSESLHTFVDWALEGAEISLKDIEAVSLGKGPGSYTGLRIGAASAKGFCYGLKVPLIAINSLETMIEPFFVFLNQIRTTKYYLVCRTEIDGQMMDKYIFISFGEGQNVIHCRTSPLVNGLIVIADDAEIGFGSS